MRIAKGSSVSPQSTAAMHAGLAVSIFAAAARVLDVATRWFDLDFGVGAGSGPDSFMVKAMIGVHPPE